MNTDEWANTVEWVGIVAGNVIVDDGKYLLIQESNPKVYGLWNLPAGYVDKGETIEQAAVREAKEETGYDVKVLEKIGVYHEKIGTPVLHAFRSEIIGGALQIQEGEILSAAWLTIAEIEELRTAEMLRAPWIWDSISKVHAEVQA